MAWCFVMWTPWPAWAHASASVARFADGPGAPCPRSGRMRGRGFAVLLDRCDTALYRAKANGGNRIVMAGDCVWAHGSVNAQSFSLFHPVAARVFRPCTGPRRPGEKGGDGSGGRHYHTEADPQMHETSVAGCQLDGRYALAQPFGHGQGPSLYTLGKSRANSSRPRARPCPPRARSRRRLRHGLAAWPPVAWPKVKLLTCLKWSMSSMSRAVRLNGVKRFITNGDQTSVHEPRLF